jgi:beta-glucosidase
MTKKSILTVLIAGICISCNSNQTPQLGRQSVDKVLAAMTLEEKALLVTGAGMAGFSGDNAVVGETHSLVPGAAGATHPVPRLGIPAIVVADGPAGLRIAPTREGSGETYYCTAFPIATLLASTWNTGLVEDVGRAMGNEVLEYGVDVLLGPALNIHRNPLCGRNFEYYSEDPVLTGKIAAAMVKGVQSNGVGTSIKHFAANNQESNRMSNDARITPRTLREIYLKGFEIAVKESNPQTVMTSYNYINGTYASESRELLTDILRDEWGFKGTVMTDWFGGKNAPAQIYAGNDLLMPGRPDQKDAIVKAIQNGTLDEKDLDTDVRRILNLILESPRFNGYKYSNKPDLKAHAGITRESAAEGMVLLKNERILPLPAETKQIAAFGITSYDFISGGTGSGDVNEAYTVSLTEGLSQAGYHLNETLSALYEKHINAENEKNKPDPSNSFAAFMPKIRPAEWIPATDALKKTAAEADIALITLGRTSGEFMDRRIPNDFELSNDERKLIRDVCAAFHAAGKKAVVILNIGGVIETASWKELPDAILLAWQAGQEGGNTVADILSGKVNPSGKLTMSFPLNYSDVPSANNFPSDYVSGPPNLFGAPETEKKELVRNVDYTIYEEDIYVGYRYYDTQGKPTSYPFGYGLSYTEFDYLNPSIKADKDNYTVTVEVKNNGNRPGKEVVQLYVSAPQNSLYDKPEKELKAFAKTGELKPGESQILTITVAAADLASFSEQANAWITDKGTYRFLIATSSRDIKASLEAVR